MLKLKLRYFGHLMRRVDSLEKTDAGRDWGQEEKGTTEDEMAGWHHWLDGRESEWTLGVGDGQGGLECCDSWGRKESDTTEQLNWTELNWPGEFIFQCSVTSFSYCSWGSQGKNTEVVCHSFLQWTTFCQNSPPWPICLRWPYKAWLIVSWDRQCCGPCDQIG